MFEDLPEPDPERIRPAQEAFLKFLAEIVADDTYVVVGPRPDQLRHDAGTGTFVLTDSTGQVFTFHDFGVGQTSLRGRGTSIAHPGGAGKVATAKLARSVAAGAFVTAGSPASSAPLMTPSAVR